MHVPSLLLCIRFMLLTFLNVYVLLLCSPANSEASRLYQENRREYNRRVKEVVEQSWNSDDDGTTAADSSTGGAATAMDT